jgi:hypothetical protein
MEAVRAGCGQGHDGVRVTRGEPCVVARLGGPSGAAAGYPGCSPTVVAEAGEPDPGSGADPSEGATQATAEARRPGIDDPRSLASRCKGEHMPRASRPRCVRVGRPVTAVGWGKGVRARRRWQMEFRIAAPADLRVPRGNGEQRGAREGLLLDSREDDLRVLRWMPERNMVRWRCPGGDPPTAHSNGGGNIPCTRDGDSNTGWSLKFYE